MFTIWYQKQTTTLIKKLLIFFFARTKQITIFCQWHGWKARNSVKILDLDTHYFLFSFSFCGKKFNLENISFLAWNQKEKSFELVCCVGCKLDFSVVGLIFSNWKSDQLLLFIIFVKQVILQNNDYSSRSIRVSRNRNKHMSGGINRRLLFSNDGVHSEVHFVVNDVFFNTSCIYKSLLIFNLAIIHLETYKHCILASCIECDHIDENSVCFMCFFWW